MAEGDPNIGKKDIYRGDLITLSTPDDPMPTLYHYDGSYFSQVARLTLEEEGVEYRSRAMDIGSQMEHLEAWYIRVNKSAVVPTLIHKGKEVPESRDIAMFVANQLSSEHKLLPREGPEREKVIEMMDLHDTLPIEPLTQAQMMTINKAAAFFLPSNTKKRIETLEKLKGERPELSDLIDARIPDLVQRLEYFKEPVKYKDESLVTLSAALDVVEKKLSEGGGPFICGQDYTLADVCFTCVVARYSMVSLMDEAMKNRPKVAEWWARVESRPSFKGAQIFKDPVTIAFILKKVFQKCTLL